MAQWWRIHLPVQETLAGCWVREDPTCLEANNPTHRNYWVCVLAPGSRNYWAMCRNYWSPHACSPSFTMRGATAREARAPRQESSLCSLQLERSVCQPGQNGGLGRMETGIYIAESLCCSLETSTMLLISYTPIQNVFGIKKRWGGGGAVHVD